MENCRNVSRWKQAVLLASKVGKGLFEDSKAVVLVTKQWLEAIDQFHRYGENLNKYHDSWLNSHSPQSFFFWLDIGHGKEIELKECSRAQLKRQLVRYLEPKEREEFEVIIENGKFIYKQNGAFVHTTKGLKWIHVLSTSRRLFVGVKDKGLFHHSSFVSGGAVVSAGRLVVSDGTLQAIWAYSGHYCPSEESFERLIRFLDEQHVDLTNVELRAVKDDAVPHLNTTSFAKRATLFTHFFKTFLQKEREEFEVIIENGKFIYKQNGAFVHTTKGLKWMHVLSTSRRLFVGVKDKGLFQHSSFVSGGAVVSAGGLVVSDGTLQAIWAYSGHYRPSEESFERLIRFLDEQHVDLTNVELRAVDDDAVPPSIDVSKSDGVVPPINVKLSETDNAPAEFVDQQSQPELPI